MKSKALYNWLKSHPLINLNGLCKEVGVDRANFKKWMDAEKELKDSMFDKFWHVLGNYGFAQIKKTEAPVEKLKINPDDVAFKQPVEKLIENRRPIQQSAYLQKRNNQKLGIKS